MGKFEYDHNGVGGRNVLNCYRLAEGQLKLSCFGLGNVYERLFGKRVPVYTEGELGELWFGGKGVWKVVEYYSLVLEWTVEIVEKLNGVGRTAEMAKIYGINFNSVLQRGSQYKIEASMIRAVHEKDFLLFSATRAQVANQRGLEHEPLILEPPKQLIVDPVIVVDFQSLYPSIMISHNFCYSTCLGKIDQTPSANSTAPIRVGLAHTTLDLSSIIDVSQIHNLDYLREKIFISPNNVGFLKSEVRKGVIPALLEEILQTRIMLKESIKLYSNLHIKELLGNLQMGLKLFMNVMYGYTAAGYSGRMPCVDIGDSVVATGKQIL
jgi:DNA polymerase zeta